MDRSSIIRRSSNNEFASNFHTRASIQLDSIDKELENFDYMLEDIALDFKYNKNVIQSYEFLLLFRMKFDGHIERHSANYTSDQLDYVTKVCRKANETFYFNLIREKYFALMNVSPAGLARSEDFLGANQEVEKVKNQVEMQVQEQPKGHEEEEFMLPSVEKVQQPAKVKVASANDDDNEETPKVETKQNKLEDGKNKLKQFDELLQKFHEDFSNHKIDFAHSWCEKIAEFARSQGELEESQRAYIQKKMEENEKIFKECERLYKDMIFVHKELADEVGWAVEKVRKGMVVKYKANKGESVGLKFEMEMDVPIINLLSLIYEVDLYPQWFPFLKKGTEIKTINRATKVAHVELSFPPPVANREGYFYGCGFDRLETNGTIFMTVKSIHNDPETTSYYDVEIPGTSKHVRLDVKFFAFEIQLISKDKIFIKAVANVDPKLKFLPMSLINWTIRKFSHMMIEKMLSKARNITGTPWEQRTKQDPAFYEWATKVAEDHFSRLESNSGNTQLP